MQLVFIAVVLISIVSLAAAAYFAWEILREPVEPSRLTKISDAIRQGSEAFLKRQYKSIALFSAILAVLLYLFYANSNSANIKELGDSIAWRVTVSFLLGAVCSALSGYIGMYVSIRTNIRVALAATRSLPEALRIAFRGGAVSGITVVALSLLGVGGLFWIFDGFQDPQLVPLQIVGFGFGASFVALFAQLGGGIYTKAADVGADLVGKVEAGIPEDDPRNPAVIADLVGDNVGDCAGRGADLFESTAAENIGAMILGIALYPVFGLKGILFPLLARALGLIASIVGIWSVKAREDEDPMASLNRGYHLTTLLAAAGFYVAVAMLLDNNLWFFAAGVAGILTALAMVYVTEYYTEYKYRPVASIARASQTGPATNIITGLSVAMECTGIPILILSAAVLVAYFCGVKALPGVAGAGLYGTAMATMGMLSSCAFILAMDTFGPITDNAGGIVEMSDQPEAIRKRTDKLDAAGNTTKALTKGYAIGSAALAAFLLFRAYLDEVEKITHTVVTVDLAKVPNFVGGLIGGALVFVFSAFAIHAVGRAAYYVINEVRRQFKEHPGILQGTEEPDYGRCVDIVTIGALKEMIIPGLMPVVVPLLVGVTFKKFSGSGLPGAEAVAAMLMVGTIVGILMALVMNNGGGAWDNAKKYIETGQFGGKRSEAHVAAVVGDTVGDPLKDTAGPSLHVLIKLLSTVTLVLAPLFL